MRGPRAGTRGGTSDRLRSASARRCLRPAPKLNPGAGASGGASDMILAFDLARRIAAIVIGRAGLDLYPLPDGTKTEHAGQFAAEIGGSAGNIAVALSRQGFPAALLVPLSRSEERRVGKECRYR